MPTHFEKGSSIMRIVFLTLSAIVFAGPAFAGDIPAVPEVSVAGSFAALTVFGGIAAWLVERRRK
jgi:hypothetical protein